VPTSPPDAPQLGMVGTSGGKDQTADSEPAPSRVGSAEDAAAQREATDGSGRRWWLLLLLGVSVVLLGGGGAACWFGRAKPETADAKPARRKGKRRPVPKEVDG
jgi:hypothetical protein